MSFHLIEPDLGRVSGGLRYNHAVIDAAGSRLRRQVLPGAWPEPSTDDICLLQEWVDGLDQPVLVDGLIGCSLPTPLTATTPIVQLVHSLAQDTESRRREGACLKAASAVITTSNFAAGELDRRYGITAEVAPPGTRSRGMAAGGGGKNLICVGAIEDNKNQLFLANVLHHLGQRGMTGWHCTFVGPVTDAAYADRLRHRLDGLPHESTAITGELDAAAMDDLYQEADLLLLSSRSETFGMVVREAATAGIPAFVTAGTGGAEALVAGRALPLDEDEWTEALYRWMSDSEGREDLRDRARRDRNDAVHGWEDTARTILTVMEGAS